MAHDFSDAIKAEIAALEGELAHDPRYAKLHELRRLQTLYTASAPIRSADVVRAPRVSVGRSPSPERKAILAHAQSIISRGSEPVATAALYDALTESGVIIPGASPRNNLSAMLSNSDDFVSNGRAGWTLAQQSQEASGASSEGATPEAPTSSPASPAGEPL